LNLPDGPVPVHFDDIKTLQSRRTKRKIMTFPATGKVVLRTNLADHPISLKLKDGSIRSDLVEFDFAGPKVANQGFKPMVREGAFAAGELAIATYIQAKAWGKKLVALPAPIVSRTQHHTIVFNANFGTVTPKDLEGKKVGIRAYSVTTVMWVRGILQHQYGVDLSKIHWITVEDPHVAEFVDPPSCTRVKPGETLEKLLADGEIIAAVLGDKMPDVPGFTHLFPQPNEMAKDWMKTNGIHVPINHIFCVHSDLPKERPDVVKEVYRMLVEANAAAPEAAAKMAPFGLEPNRKSLQMALDFCSEQGLVPKPMTVNDLFDDVTRQLGA
jgi:4,5-dihydroxyphthalate decarboxylase